MTNFNYPAWNRVEPEVLKVAAVAVAGPRYMGAFASAIGVNLVDIWPLFVYAEIWSGLAMALLEGWAIAFMFRRWRVMRVKSLQWKILLALQLALLAALPLVATPYLLSSQLGLAVSQLFPLWLLAVWSFLLAAIAPLVLAAVGYADSELSKPAKEKSKPAIAAPLPITFSCPICNTNSFSSKQAVNAHMRVHK